MSNNNSIKGILGETEQKLKSCGIEDASLEASLLLEAFSSFNRLEQLLYPERELNKKQVERIKAAVEERCQHKPLSQILGEIYFYGRPFYVNENVLAPRPDTEILVEAVLKEIEKRYAQSRKKLTVLDSCTGSGCIGISIWLESAAKEIISQLDLCDFSEKALKVAYSNAVRHSLPEQNVRFFNCDLWPGEEKHYDVITCNPPYISRADINRLMPEVALHEPQVALDGGRDGLDFYRRLAMEAPARLLTGGILALEHAYDQRQAIKMIFGTASFNLQAELDDYGGNARVLIFKKAD